MESVGVLGIFEGRIKFTSRLGLRVEEKRSKRNFVGIRSILNILSNVHRRCVRMCLYTVGMHCPQRAEGTPDHMGILNEPGVASCSNEDSEKNKSWCWKDLL